jgi:uracil-DNA glycosylase family 4
MASIAARTAGGPQRTRRDAQFEQAMSRREQYLQLLGLEVWQLRQPPTPSSERVERAPPEALQPAEAPLEAAADAGGSDAIWERLREEVAACTRCALCGSRTQTVFGVGNRRARLLVVGEAPGAEEDRRGEPFVGRAGQLLNSMLRAIGCPREQVYIANVLKCRPPGNRDPSPTEVAACLPYLQRQIDLLAPALILVVGRIAAQNLLATEVPIARLRGTVHRFGASEIPLVVTYHPAYLLRSPGEKRRAWVDLKLARAQLRRTPEPAPAQVGAQLTAADAVAGGRRGGLGGRATADGANSA